MKQHDTGSTIPGARWLTPGRRERLRLVLVLMACLLFGSACATSTLVTQVVHQDGGQDLIGQSMSIEFNQEVWNALKDDDRSQLGGLFDTYQTKGWNVTKQDGGRIQTVSFDPASFADLQAKGWTISVDARPTGNITTASWSPNDNSSGGSTSGLQQITVTIDQSDPQTTHYKYQATVMVQYQDSSGNNTEPTGDGSPFGFIMAQAVATAEADPSYANLQQALKDAGPPKINVTVSLPGTIESTTINGNQGGNTSGNQVTWNITMDQNATFNLEATASGSGGGSGSGSSGSDAFGVSVSCQGDYPGDPGEVVCVANSVNKPDGAEIEFEWKFDGQLQEERGNTLDLHGVPKGDHSVSVVAIATNQNNLRSQPGGATFTKTTGADAAVPTATTSGNSPSGFTVSLTCSVSDNNILCLATPSGAPADANLTYKWMSNGSAISGTGASATIATSGEGIYQVAVTVTDSKSGQSATASTTTPVGSAADPIGTIWNKIPDDTKAKINIGLTGNASITPPSPSDISAGAILGALGTAALAGASALGIGGAAPAVPGNAPGTPDTPPNQQGQGQGNDGTDKKDNDNQKSPKSKQLDFCTNEVNALQAASSQARDLQNQLQAQRSQMNALQLQYEQLRENMLTLGGVTLVAIPVAIFEAAAGSLIASAGLGGYSSTMAGGMKVMSNSLADIRNQINGTQQYISDLEGQFSSAMQGMQNAKSALDGCRALHPGGPVQ